MKIFLYTLFLIIFPGFIYGQAITGNVVDNYQQALQDAHILNKTTDNHTHSNQQGNFTLDHCSLGDTIQISFIGFQTELFVIETFGQIVTTVLSEEVISLEEVTISPRIDALEIITKIDIQTKPVNSSQDILRSVPGLFIGQHAGGGKAEQIFLRGFDIDHGTDINISVDGLPVNMVSHAHGQGYADLHFVIPETIHKIDFGKGPYYENQGNFNTAGYVGFNTKDYLENSLIKWELGQFNTHRLLGMFNVLQGKKHNAYIASEFLSSDGFFESSQNFNRTNLFGKYSGVFNKNDFLEMTISHFNSQWDASGQIPQRSVDLGSISRFGAIDDTEGGLSSRTNFNLSHTKIIDEKSSIRSRVYFSHYDFELYSNFTFFLIDSINGDQIKQKENRSIYGVNTEYTQSYTHNNLSGVWRAGIDLRNDKSVDNELSHTLNRKETLENIQLGDINETNIGAFLGTTIDLSKWTINPSIRVDYFDFQYHDKLITEYKKETSDEVIVSPN